MINKNSFKKYGDRKVLHKIKKNWVVVSTALLIMIGGATATVQAKSVNHGHYRDRVARVAPKRTRRNAAPKRNHAVQSSVAPQSSRSASAASASSEDYLDTYGGSAASYHARAEHNNSLYSKTNPEVQAYVDSLNRQYPASVDSINSVINSDVAHYREEMSDSASFAAIANDKNYLSELTSYANRNNQTASGYVDSAEYAYHSLSDRAVSGSDYVKNVKLADNYVTNLVNGGTSADIHGRDLTAANSLMTVDRQLLATSMEEDNVNSFYNQLNYNYHSALAYSESAFDAENTAKLDSSNDAEYVKQLAHNVGYPNSVATSSIVGSLARQYAGSSSVSAYFNGHLIAGSASAPDASNPYYSSADLYYVVSNTAAQDHFNRRHMSMINSYISATSKAMKPLRGSQGSYAEKLSKYGSEESQAVNAYYMYNTLDQYGSNALYTMFGGFAPGTVQIPNYLSVPYVTGNSAYNNGSYNTSSEGSLANGTLLQRAPGAANWYNGSFYYPVGENSMAQSIASSLAANPVSASVDISSLANSDTVNLEGAYLSDVTALSNFINSAGIKVALAKHAANSYRGNVNVTSASVASAEGRLSSFYSDGFNHNAKARYANDVAKSANYDRNNDTAMAQAYGINIYNHSPKYLIVTKPALLHLDTNYGSQHDTKKAIKLAKGTPITVLGIGVNRNGYLRYSIQYHHTKGYITANPQYVSPVYWSADTNADIIVDRPVRVYKSAAFDRKNDTGQMYPVGTELHGNIVSEDNNEYGFTRIRLDNGKYITANVRYVTVAAGAHRNYSTNNFSDSGQKF